jgi:hypothetical protein
MSTTASGTIARPKTACQPYTFARRGARRFVSTVPLLPAAAIPMASPWRSGGYQRLASGSATAKEAPPTPSMRPTARSDEKVEAQSHPRDSGTKRKARSAIPARRPPMRSPRMPSGIRSRDPERMGTATISPFCATFKPAAEAANTPRAPSRTHSMKLRSKWRKQAMSVGRWPVRASSRFKRCSYRVRKVQATSARRCVASAKASSNRCTSRRHEPQPVPARVARQTASIVW